MNDTLTRLKAEIIGLATNKQAKHEPHVYTRKPAKHEPHVYTRFIELIAFFGMQHDTLRGTASLNVFVPGITNHFTIIIEVFRSQDETLRFFPKVRFEESLFHDNELCINPEDAMKSAIAYLKDRIEINLKSSVEHKDHK